MRVATALAALLACGDSQPLSSPAQPPHRDALADAPAALLESTRDLVTAVVADWTATTATLRRYHREHGSWQLVDTWPGVIGAGGAAWGIGLHGSGAPAGRGGPVQREGGDRS